MYEQGQDRTTPYGPPQAARVSHHIFRHGSPRLVIFAAIAGLLGLAVAAASLTFALSFRASAETQIRQLQQALGSAQANSASNTYSINSQAAKISAVNAAMSAVAQFSQVCSTDLNGPNGTPAAFYFMCSAAKPGG